MLLLDGIVPVYASQEDPTPDPRNRRTDSSGLLLEPGLTRPASWRLRGSQGCDRSSHDPSALALEGAFAFIDSLLERPYAPISVLGRTGWRFSKNSVGPQMPAES